MISQPKVSIVIPVYNGANYLQTAIDSALGQTYNNVEVLVVNDGSTDNGASAKIALSYGNRIRYLEKENGGVSSALNLGLREMKGEYFAWLSHDDYFSENRIDTDISLILQHNVKAAFTDIVTIDEHGNEVSRSSWNKFIRSPLDVMQNDGIHFSALTMSRNIMLKLGGFDEKNRSTQDVQLTLLAAKEVDFYKNENALTFIRIHEVHRERKEIMQKQQARDSFYMGKKLSLQMDHRMFSRHLDFSSETIYESEAALAYADFFFFTANRNLFFKYLITAWLNYPFYILKSQSFVLLAKLLKRSTIDLLKLLQKKI